MSSKQLYFHISENDLSSIQKWMDRNNIILIGVPVNETTEVLETIELPIRQGQWDLLYFTHKDFYPNLVRFNYNEVQKKYYLDILKSNAIEFSRPTYSDDHKKLRGCRLYAALRYYEHDILVNKDEIFIKWVDEIYKKFKKEFLIKLNGSFVSNKAISEESLLVEHWDT